MAERAVRGLTLVEVVVSLVIVVVTFISLAILFQYSRHSSIHVHHANCKENCSQIGKALAFYTQTYSGFYPFVQGPHTLSDSGRIGTSTLYEADASSSLAALYPLFLSTAKSYRCPVTRQLPSLATSPEVRVRDFSTQSHSDANAWKNSTWYFGSYGKVSNGRTALVITEPSYGYDPRISPRAIGNHAILGDMDGSWQVNPKTRTQNHEGGHNILYADGHVAWVTTNFASNDPSDNIFAEGGTVGATTQYWNADTDSYLVRGNVDLGPSYNGYPSLQPGSAAKAQP